MTSRLPRKAARSRAGDILILVRRRDPFTTPMIRELKRLDVPVAGADRMKLTDQLAVQDLVALADFLLMPDDDLTLAVVLKSPLFGFDDDDLFKLAYGPRGSLWAALQSKAKDDVRFAAAVETLTAWLARADFLPPYEFFSELLGADGQRLRKAMLTRLGPEAAEAIDEFLDIALAYDREAAPSLQGFVNQLRAGDVEIKRDMEQERDEVRIMTVHGAKGLQAPIVFLPDTCMAPRQQGIGLYPLPRAGEHPDEVGHLIWPPRGLSNLAGIEQSKQAVLRAEREEYHRLLYVGMTRAEDRLYIGGWEGLKRHEKDVWYDLVKDGLAGHLTPHVGSDGRPLSRMESQQTEPAKPPEAKSEQAAPEPLPAWALISAPRERPRPKLAPSQLNLGPETEPEALPDQPPLGPLALSENGRYARGRLVHALLQHLPEVDAKDQERAARAFVAVRGIGLTARLAGGDRRRVARHRQGRLFRAFVPAGKPRRGSGRGADRRLRSGRPDRPSCPRRWRFAHPRLQDQPAAAQDTRGGGARLYRPARRLPAGAQGALPRPPLARRSAVDRRTTADGDSFNFA